MDIQRKIIKLISRHMRQTVGIGPAHYIIVIYSDGDRAALISTFRGDPHIPAPQRRGFEVQALEQALEHATADLGRRSQ